MRPSLRFLGIVVIVLATAAPAAAILDGKPDTAHPYVGILVTDIDGQRVPVCSGFLVNSTTFVTAAHCVDDLGDLPALRLLRPALHAGLARSSPAPQFRTQASAPPARTRTTSR